MVVSRLALALLDLCLRGDRLDWLRSRLKPFVSLEAAVCDVMLLRCRRDVPRDCVVHDDAPGNAHCGVPRAAITMSVVMM